MACQPQVLVYRKWWIPSPVSDSLPSWLEVTPRWLKKQSLAKRCCLDHHTTQLRASHNVGGLFVHLFRSLWKRWLVNSQWNYYVIGEYNNRPLYTPQDRGSCHFHFHCLSPKTHSVHVRFNFLSPISPYNPFKQKSPTVLTVSIIFCVCSILYARTPRPMRK